MIPENPAHALNETIIDAKEIQTHTDRVSTQFMSKIFSAMRANGPPEGYSRSDWNDLTSIGVERQRARTARKLYSLRAKCRNLDDLIIRSTEFPAVRADLAPLLTSRRLELSDSNILRLMVSVFMARDDHPSADTLANTWPEVQKDAANAIAGRLYAILGEVSLGPEEEYCLDYHAGALVLAYEAQAASHRISPAPVGQNQQGSLVAA